ncbi:Jlp1p [Sugiyamaella lignohabitans]|uniref:Jlp1p n=1 Tax=Sugiyamaella lignohabitans TaxID=796027 RepID=A0A167DQ89_9ASCO|nr:Jlp1p [Sugiyamaella lignohabitans]ANB13162.1 Jlp1p [Sugiyamaella lignohabitans]
MSPAVATTLETDQLVNDFKKKVGFKRNYSKLLPANTLARYKKHGVDVSGEYPEVPTEYPVFLEDAINVRNKDRPHNERGAYADKEKKALFGAAKEVINLTANIGTEIVGLQLADLDDKQKDELALLIAERTVVFFRDQDLSPKKQLELGKYFGEVEVHPLVPHVPGLEGVTVLWPQQMQIEGGKATHKKPLGTAQWHSDLSHEYNPAGITHLHNDALPPGGAGGDTAWVSGYGAYDKLSPALQEFLDGKTAIYRSAHSYIDKKNPLGGLKFIEREHPIVRTHPATGWKALWINRHYTTRIVGLEPNESAAILNLLFDVFEKNLDIQVRFNWHSKPSAPGRGTSALWDNRISQHYAVFDYDDDERHGTRVAVLSERPYFDKNSKSRRQALGLD